MRWWTSVVVAGLAVALAAPWPAVAQTGKDKPKPPYFGSIAAGKARMRSGPGRAYPATWLYVRPDLPVRVIDIFKEWRKVEDPAGTQGWILGTLVSSTRTGIVQGTPNDPAVELRDRPAAGGKVVWRAAPGVVGRLSECRDGWCRIDVRGQAGFVEAARLWGVSADERLP